MLFRRGPQMAFCFMYLGRWGRGLARVTRAGKNPLLFWTVALRGVWGGRNARHAVVSSAVPGS